MAADTGTRLGSYLDSLNGLSAQCRELNDLISSVCCTEYELGCEVTYTCEIVSSDGTNPMSRTPHHYEVLEGRPSYPLHQDAVIRDVELFLSDLSEVSRDIETLLIAYTRYQIFLDDEATGDVSRKIQQWDVRFHWLGVVMPAPYGKTGSRLLLDYYASPLGLLLSVTPLNKSSLAQAVAEYRSQTFSFSRRQFTDTGARDLFELAGNRIVPNRLGCSHLSRR